MRTLTTAEMEQVAWAIQQQRDTGADSSIQLAIAAVIELQKIETTAVAPAQTASVRDEV